MNGFQGKKNVYICDDCGHGFVSMDVDAGVTPFLTSCLNCGALAKSMCYKIPQPLLGTPAVTWLRPRKEIWGKFSIGIQQHLEKGGLIRSDTKGLPGDKKRKAFRQ